MPDPKGNYTPADISQLSIQGLLGKRELEQGDQDQAMKALEFQRKIQHADLDAELKKLNLYFDQTRKSLLDRVLEGNFQNPTPQEKMVLRLIGIESKPEDFASPEDLKTGAKVGMGLQPSANAQLGADVDRERIGLGREELAARVRAMTVEGFNSLVAAGADPMALSQGDIGDPETIAKAFAGAVPTARMQALTNYALGVAQITHMNAQAALYEAQAKAESE
ncbi:MAG TPA: hypothetical protein VFB61_09725, partial [Gemmatimonadales bacterium]|nr:hypothetical protein [Gemmatimonadales bacterium]